MRESGEGQTEVPEPYTYREITSDVRVEVQPFYVRERSNPRLPYYFFAYRIRITNDGPNPCQLLSRHWIIRDGKGKEEEIRGAGVVGQQPDLSSGETFTYTSFCPLSTPTGNMRGSYEMVDSLNRKFQVKIPVFFSTTATKFTR